MQQLAEFLWVFSCYHQFFIIVTPPPERKQFAVFSAGFTENSNLGNKTETYEWMHNFQFYQAKLWIWILLSCYSHPDFLLSIPVQSPVILQHSSSKQEQVWLALPHFLDLFMEFYLLQIWTVIKNLTFPRPIKELRHKKQKYYQQN